MKNVFVSGMDLKRKIHVNKSSKLFKGKKAIRFNCRGFGKKNRGKLKSPVLLASLKSQTGLLSLGKEKYQGEILVVANHSKPACDVINQIPIESYISSLLSKEMNSKWSLEALKAQAVAARTYALHKMKSNQVSRGEGHEVHYDLESSEKHQVGGSFFDATRKTELASRSTQGEVLLGPDKHLKPIFFHASCGGKTLKPDQVWENHVDGYESVDCRYCLTSPKRKWDKKIVYRRLVSFIKWAGRKGLLRKQLVFTAGEKIRIAPDRPDNNVLRFYVGEELHLIEKSDFRRYFGRVLFPSNYFYVKFNGRKGLRVRGNGNGHGVGLCQVGAYDLARKGKTYKEILSHYFPNHKIKKMY
ncbi:MAG: SpoIID/LytB domain-containing protein [Bacteriovoracaceae bacterium]|nr:SpoIID/LytB domain-containing protein [Bacteriovoracaceae bacterium]